MKRIMVQKGLAFPGDRLVRILFPSIILLVTMVSSSMAQSATISSRLISTGRGMPPNDIVWHDNFEEGWRLAKRLKRPMVIFITSDRCLYCESMKRNTWCDSGIQSRIKQGFVAIRLSPKRNAKTLQRIKVPAYPTTLVGHPNGHIVDHKIGYQPPTVLHTLLEKADGMFR